MAALLAALFLSAPAALAAKRSASAAVRKTTGKRIAPKTPVKRTASRKSSKKRRAASRRPPRQQTPTSERYREIQQALREKGYYSGEVNGAWGADSVEALKRFQADNRLQPDGKLGALSIISLGLGPKRAPLEFPAKAEGDVQRQP